MAQKIYAYSAEGSIVAPLPLGATVLVALVALLGTFTFFLGAGLTPLMAGRL